MIPEETRPCANCGLSLTRKATKRLREQARWYCSSCRGKEMLNKRGALRHGKPSLVSRARAAGIPERIVYQRIERGWSEERATTEPVAPRVPSREYLRLEAKIERVIQRLIALLEQKAALDKLTDPLRVRGAG